MHARSSSSKGSQGFTLVELLVVSAFIGILVALFATRGASRAEGGAANTVFE